MSASSSHTQASSSAASASSDKAQAARMAHYDLARYSHHSTLLYAVPPSSIGCLDLLVGLYGWVGGLLGESLGRQHDTSGVKGGSLTTSATPATKYHELAPLETLSCSFPAQSTDTFKSSLAESLACLGQVRSDLLQGWAIRNQQTSVLENESTRTQNELDASAADSFLGRRDQPTMTISSRGIEHKKGTRMHKVHRSVGGRLREFLTHGGSAPNLAGIASGDKSSGASLDGLDSRGDIGTIMTRLTTMPRAGVSEDSDPSVIAMPCPPIDGNNIHQTFTPPLPLGTPTPRPTLPFRHSIHVPREPFLPHPFLTPPDSSLAPAKYGGVGDFDGSGDEDGLREEVGRKKEGVLWGAGVWEGLTKPSGKGKWESKLST